MTAVPGRIRTCVGCRAERPKNEMLRVVRGADGVIAVETNGRLQGRGAYICPNPECLNAAVKKKALSRALKRPVGNEIYAMIEPFCIAGEKQPDCDESEENAAGQDEKALSLLGMARKARALIVGQDKVFAAARGGNELLIITSADCSPNVMRKALSSNCETLAARDFSRETLGAAVGVMNAQIVALPRGSGFVKKLKELLVGGTLNG